MRLAWPANSVSVRTTRSGAPSTDIDPIEPENIPTSKPRSSAMRAEIASYTDPGWTQRLPERIARKRSRRSVQFMVSSSQVFGMVFRAVSLSWDEAGPREEIVDKRIAVIGAGAIGGYTGGQLAHNGFDVTLIDPWPEHVETIRSDGLALEGMTQEEYVCARPKTMHLTEAQQLAKEKPIDIAMVAVKSYDTAWATMLIAQYLAPDGYVVSLQNCMNEETIAGIVGWGKTLGCIASSITVNLPEPGLIHRGAGKGGRAHTVFRAGEVHGRITKRAEQVCHLVAYADSAKVTGNLWGERWSKLVTNAMANGIAACTGLSSGEMLHNDPIRHFSTRVGSEAIRVGQALGYQLEEIYHLPPETIARAGEGDEAAMRACDEERFRQGKRTAAGQHPSMGQDMQKGRRTEIEFLNGLVVREGEKVGLTCRANDVLTDIVKRVERGELKPDPRHITELRLN